MVFYGSIARPTKTLTSPHPPQTAKTPSLTFQSNVGNRALSRHSTSASCTFTKNEDPYHIVIAADSLCITHLQAISEDPYSLLPSLPNPWPQKRHRCNHVSPENRLACTPVTSPPKIQSHKHPTRACQPSTQSQHLSDMHSAPKVLIRPAHSGFPYLSSRRRQGKNVRGRSRESDSQDTDTDTYLPAHRHVSTASQCIVVGRFAGSSLRGCVLRGTTTTPRDHTRPSFFTGQIPRKRPCACLAITD